MDRLDRQKELFKRRYETGLSGTVRAVSFVPLDTQKRLKKAFLARR